MRQRSIKRHEGQGGTRLTGDKRDFKGPGAGRKGSIGTVGSRESPPELTGGGRSTCALRGSKSEREMNKELVSITYRTRAQVRG